VGGSVAGVSLVWWPFLTVAVAGPRKTSRV
jgi:hypothetical protein